MAVTVQVPYGLEWSTGGHQRVVAQGSTLGEVWDDLHAAYPEMMWRLSLEQGPPSFWVRVTINGQPGEHPVRLETPLADGSEIEIHILPGSGAATGTSSGKKAPAGCGTNRG